MLIFIFQLQSPFCLLHEQFRKVLTPNTLLQLSLLPLSIKFLLLCHCLLFSFSQNLSHDRCIKLCTQFSTPTKLIFPNQILFRECGGFHFTGMFFSVTKCQTVACSFSVHFRECSLFQVIPALSGECHYLYMSKCRLGVKAVAGHTGAVWVTEELKCSVLHL